MQIIDQLFIIKKNFLIQIFLIQISLIQFFFSKFFFQIFFCLMDQKLYKIHIKYISDHMTGIVIIPQLNIH